MQEEFDMFQYKKAIAILSAAVFMAASPLSSMASTQTKINSVSLVIDSDLEAGSSDSDVSVTTSSSKYSVEETTVTNTPSDEWEEGDKPKLKVYLEAEDDYYFDSGFSKSSVSISGSDGTITSVSRSSSSELIVYITLDALDEDSDSGDYDLTVNDLDWTTTTGNASWEEADDANKYEVRLYKGGSTVTSVFTTTSSSYNFSSYITSSGYYTFKVRGVYNSSNKGSWETSDSWYVSSTVAEEISSNSSNSSTSNSSGPGTTASTGAWLKDNTGWWYCNADKSYTVSNWQSIDGTWYYFNEYGYMVTGWVSWNTKWYYCGSNGAMYSSATTPDGYIVGSDGAWTGE
jgi:glucan-binding YG repeat protein